MQTIKREVAFIVREFPVVSETFIINQVADLIDRGIEVQLFSFEKSDKKNISQRFYKYNMLDKVHYLNTPINFFVRFFLQFPK